MEAEPARSGAWMGAGVARIRNEIAHPTVGCGEPRWNGRCCVHEQEPAQKQPTGALGAQAPTDEPHPEGTEAWRQLLPQCVIVLAM
jgi:hypothetical protein